MKMRTILNINGEYFFSEASTCTEAEFKVFCDKCYTKINEFGDMKLYLEDGKVMIIGREILRRSIFIFEILED